VAVGEEDTFGMLLVVVVVFTGLGGAAAALFTDVVALELAFFVRGGTSILSTASGPRTTFLGRPRFLTIASADIFFSRRGPESGWGCWKKKNKTSSSWLGNSSSGWMYSTGARVGRVSD
jgi:hypothetical protein